MKRKKKELKTFEFYAIEDVIQSKLILFAINDACC